MVDFQYARVAEFFRTNAWAVRAETLAVMQDVLRFRMEGGEMSRSEIRARLPNDRRERAIGMAIISAALDDFDALSPGGAARENRRDALAQNGNGRTGSVAVIPIHGVIAPRASVFAETSSNGTGLDVFVQRLRQADADAGVGSIVFDIDSPGGSVSGVPEAAAEIRAVRERKKIIAVANASAASAAYWLASQASEIMVTPSGAVGSIGVFGAHEDVSKRLEAEGIAVTLISAGKYKTEGNPFEPLGEEARAAWQAQVNDYYKMFTADVAEGRGEKASDVRAGFGQGRMVMAAAAVKEGMADRIGTLEQAVDRALGRKPKEQAKAAVEAPALAAAVAVPEPQPPAPPVVASDDGFEVRRRRQRLRELAQ